MVKESSVYAGSCKIVPRKNCLLIKVSGVRISGGSPGKGTPRERACLFILKGAGVMTDEKLARINELARKAREAELDEAEREEQQRLRQEYVAAFRGNLERQLNSMVIVDEAGNRRNVQKRGKQQ
jgi:uncharacterized protein YnzC (UPF0291/DUF896 family)